MVSCSSSCSNLKSLSIKGNALVVDDEEDIRNLVVELLTDSGYSALSASDSTEAINLIYSKKFDVVLLDLWLVGSDLDGLGILETIKASFPNLPVIVISGHGTASTATTALHMGAYDYIEKPFFGDRLSFVVDQAVEVARLKRENEEYKAFEEPISIIGNSHATRNLRMAIDKIASTSSRVLIQGPFGSGKGIVAKFIHQNSKYASLPFVSIHPSIFAGSLYMEEIFGKEDCRGNTYMPPKTGLIEQADGGTLFLDEISEFPPDVQHRLLHLVHEGVIRRESGVRKINVNVRIITSSSCSDMEELIAEKKLRGDLFYRLSIVKIKVPSLSERRADIPMLCEHFMNEICKRTGIKKKLITKEAMAVFQSYGWQGNCRQLKNIIEGLLIMCPSIEIHPNDIPDDILSDSPLKDFFNTKVISSPLREAREEFERKYLEAQLIRFGGNISKTAEFVGMERSALHRKLRSLNVKQKLLQEEHGEC